MMVGEKWSFFWKKKLVRNCKNRYFFEARYPVFGAMSSRGDSILIKSGGFCIFDAGYREMKFFLEKEVT